MSAPDPRLALLTAPLIIGVTGHRDLEPDDVPKLQHKVKHIFARLREKYPSTPLLVLSPLAEGADRLVARVGLELGARLVAPLPMQAALYEADFEEPGSVDEFRTLLAKAACAFEVAPVRDPESIRAPGPARDLRYQIAGSYVVKQSQILIALWDGVDSGKTGGTSEMVRLRTEGAAGAEDCDLRPPELFPVFHILTPRRSNPHRSSEAFHLREIYPPVFPRPERGEDYYGKTLSDLDRFNRHIQRGGEALRKETAASKRKLLTTSHEASLTPAQALAFDQYSVADALALRFQRKTVRAHLALHLLVFASFLGFVLFAELGEFRVYLLIAALLLMAAAFVTHRLSRKHALDGQSQDYRAVAEGARVRFFWRVAGIDDSVPENYLESLRSELDWIRHALRGWQATCAPTNSAAFRETLEFVQKHWIDHERRYFSHAAKTNRERAEQIEFLVKTAVAIPLAIGVAVAIAAALNSAFGYGWWEPEVREWLKWPMIGIELLLASGALLHHFGERMAYSEHAREYRKMEGIFRNAHAILEKRLAASNLDGARDCLRKLGQEALAENGEWVLLHRERPLELPHP